MKVARTAGASYHAGPRPGFQSHPSVPFGVNTSAVNTSDVKGAMV